MRLAHIVPILVLVASLQVQESRVEKPSAKVDFTHHSQVQDRQDGRFSVISFIRNNSLDRPLSVKWDDAGLLCVGSLQLPPGEVDYGTVGGVVDKPALKKNSDINYGLTLQYLARASIYVDPDKQQRANASLRTSVYERRDRDGKTTFKIEVSSSLEEKTATTTIRVVGGLSLIFQSQLLGNEPRISEGWSLTQHSSVEDVGFSDWNGWSAANFWVNKKRVPVWDRSGPEMVAARSFYSVLRSSTSTANEVTFRAQGTKIKLTNVSLAGFFPNKDGVVGILAGVYLPVVQRERN